MAQQILIGGKYYLGPLIGQGSFGQIYIGSQTELQQIYAIKKENQKCKNPSILNQARVLKSLQSSQGIPKLYWYGSQGKNIYMVSTLLGPTLQDLFVLCRKQFSMKTILMIADQILQRIEFIHSRSYMHRDIKPQNFLIGIRNFSHIIYVIDFGLSRKYMDSQTNQHIPYRQNRNIVGTARYASINTHLGIQQSRRDDLQSIGYLLIYLAKGFLPWQGIKANNKLQKYQKILEKKMSIPIELICKNLPIQFSSYMNYVRSLKFDDKPDYNFCRKNFRQLFQFLNYQYDYNFDWCQLENIGIKTKNIIIQIFSDQSSEGQNLKEQNDEGIQQSQVMIHI